MSERYIVHIHLSNRPGVCLWLTTDDDFTTDVSQAAEFTDNGEGERAVIRATSTVAAKVTEGFVTVEAFKHPIQDAQIPDAMRALLHL